MLSGTFLQDFDIVTLLDGAVAGLGCTLGGVILDPQVASGSLLRDLGLSREWFSVLLLATAISVTLVPFVASERVTRALLHWHPAQRRDRTPPKPPAGHILMLGFGATGMWVVKSLRGHGDEVLVVDDDTAIIHQLERAGIPCLRGDGSDAQILHRAGAPNARAILTGMRRVSEAEHVLQLVPGVPTIVRVAEAADAERIKRLGGIAVINAHATADAFCEWFDKLINPHPVATPDDPLRLPPAT